jgi:hypothetical protein
VNVQLVKLPVDVYKFTAPVRPPRVSRTVHPASSM